MTMNEFMKPQKLEKNSFLWSQARLLIAALALLLGGRPPAVLFFSGTGLISIVGPLLKLAWIISGVASAYLLYRWSGNHQALFGGKNKKDMIAFFISVVSGLNLGLTGLLGDQYRHDDCFE